MKSARVVMVAAVAALSFAGGASAGVVMTSTGGKVENPLACGYVLPRTKTTSYTFEAWLKMPEKVLSGTAYAMGAALGGQTGWACFYMNENSLHPTFRTATTGSKTNVYLAVSEDVPLNSWIHLAGVRDCANNQVLLYTNGVLDAAYTLAEGETFAATSETFFGVGGMGLGWGNLRATWKGALSDVRVWTTARTAEEIAANYNKRLAGNEEGLAVYYPLASAVNNATTEYVSRKPVRVNEGFALAEDATAPLADDPAPALHKAIVLNSAAGVSAIGYGIGAGAQESLTLEGWVKPGANGGQIICQGSNNSEGRLRVTSTDDRSLSIINNSWNPSGYTSKDFFPEGEWVHVAVVRDYENAQFRVYRNGELHYSEDATLGSNSGDPVTIATMNAKKPLFDGSLFEMRAWRTARTDAQIKDMYLKRAYGNEEGLFVCVHFNEEDSYYGRNVCGEWGVAKSFGPGSVSWTDDPDLPALTYAAETEPSAYFTGNGVSAGRTYQSYTDLESFTFEAWVYPKFLADGNSAYDALCCRAGGSTDEGSFSLGFQYCGSPYMYLKAASGSGQSDQVLARDIQNACIDRWDHFAFVREKKGDAYEARIYRNGNLLTTVENFSASKIYATDFVIGGRSVTTTGNGFTGAIKDVRVWNKARTAEEITADYAKRLNGREAGLIGYWPLEETSGTTLGSKVRSVSDGGLYAPFVDIPKLTLGEADKSGLVLIFR